MRIKESFGDRTIKITRTKTRYSIIRTSKKYHDAVVVLYDKDELKRLIDMLTAALKEPLPDRDNVCVDLIQTIMYVCGVEQEDILGRSRKQQIVYARHFFRYFAYKDGVNSMMQENYKWGDHGSTLHSKKVVARLIDTKHPIEYYNQYKQIKQLHERKSND